MASAPAVFSPAPCTFLASFPSPISSPDCSSPNVLPIPHARLIFSKLSTNLQPLHSSTRFPFPRRRHRARGGAYTQPSQIWTSQERQSLWFIALRASPIRASTGPDIQTSTRTCFLHEFRYLPILPVMLFVFEFGLLMACIFHKLHFVPTSWMHLSIQLWPSIFQSIWVISVHLNVTFCSFYLILFCSSDYHADEDVK